MMFPWLRHFSLGCCPCLRSFPRSDHKIKRIRTGVTGEDRCGSRNLSSELHNNRRVIIHCTSAREEDNFYQCLTTACQVLGYPHLMCIISLHLLSDYIYR